MFVLRAECDLWDGNASENRHMLNSNVALGYQPFAAEGFWEMRHIVASSAERIVEFSCTILDDHGLPDVTMR